MMIMIKIMRFVVVSLFLFVGYTQAQITIVENDINNLFGAGHQVHFLTDTTDTTFQINIGSPGVNQVYDFSSINFVLFDIGATIPGSQIPQFASRFPGDAVVLKQTVDISQNYFYYDVYHSLNNGAFIIGEAELSDNFERYVHSVPEEMFVPYPLNYGFSTTFSVTSYDTTYINGVPTFTDSYSYTLTKEADGWGTLILPGIAPLNCLRYKEVTQGEDKSFYYLTKEGYLIIVDAPISEPDFGVITATGVSLLIPGSLVGLEDAKVIPQAFSLEQNYPNPFNPSTTISYQLATPSNVILKIYNTLGEEVKTLINEYQAPGLKSITWDGKNNNGNKVTSGVYFYRMQSDGFTQTKKMVFLR